MTSFYTTPQPDRLQSGCDISLEGGVPGKVRMVTRSLLLSAVLAGVAMVWACPSAWAFAEGGDSGGYDSPQDDDPPPSDYNYSSKSFSVTMSRSLDQSDGAQGADGGTTQSKSPNQAAPQSQAQPKAHKPRRGFFQRVIHGIFGGD